MAEEEIPDFEIDINEAPRFLSEDEITDNQDEIDRDLRIKDLRKTPDYEAQIKEVSKNKSLKPSERLSTISTIRKQQHLYEKQKREENAYERERTRQTTREESDLKAEERIKIKAEKAANKILPKGQTYNDIQEDPKMLKAWQKVYNDFYKSGIKEREEEKKAREKEKAKEAKEIASERARIAKSEKSASKKGGRKTRKHGKKGKKYTKKSKKGRKHKTRKFRR